MVHFRINSAYGVFLKQNLQNMDDFIVKTEKHIKSTEEVGSDYETVKKQQEEHQVR